MDSNIFKSSDKGETQFKEKFDTHSKALITVTQRQKDLESSIDILSEKLELLDHNSISNIKKITTDIKSLRAEILELKEDINKVKEFDQKMAKQVRLMAPLDEVAKLEKYIDLWNPMEFITREEFNNSKKQTIDALREIIEEFLTGKYDTKLKQKSKEIKEEEKN